MEVKIMPELLPNGARVKYQNLSGTISGHERKGRDLYYTIKIIGGRTSEVSAPSYMVTQILNEGHADDDDDDNLECDFLLD